jgi:hypothetical protein
MFCYPKPSRLALGPIQPPIQWVLEFLPGGKATGTGGGGGLGGEAGHSPPTCAKFKNEWSYASSPPTFMA